MTAYPNRECQDADKDRLAVIAELLPVCPEPGIADGNDMCICGSGEVWPCAITKAAWLAAGLDPDAEVRKVLDEVKREQKAMLAALDWGEG